jgi:hypothetical protein
MPMNKWVIRAMTVLLFATTQGCILPIPNRSVDLYGVESRVVDARTHVAVPHVRIFDADGSDLRAESDGSGRFRLACKYQWHAAYLWGVLSYPILPFTTDITPPVRKFKVIAPGYEEQWFIAETGLHIESNPKNPMQWKLQDGRYVYVPDLSHELPTGPTWARAESRNGMLYVAEIPIRPARDRGK